MPSVVVTARSTSAGINLEANVVDFVDISFRTVTSPVNPAFTLMRPMIVAERRAPAPILYVVARELLDIVYIVDAALQFAKL